MKIKVAEGLYVESRTLFRIEWRKFYPIIVIHEKFERILKWILRGLTIIGIASSIIAFEEWYTSLIFSIVLFLIEQFFEKTAIEYTTMIVQPPPDFDIQYGQWKTNAFLIPYQKATGILAHFGPSFIDKEYATKFFEYLRTWVDDGSNDDVGNNLIISFVIEPGEKYTTYIYADLERKRLDQIFSLLADEKKHGKQQQQFVFQMFYWNTLDFKDGYLIKKFLSYQKQDEPFLFAPSIILSEDGTSTEFLTDLAIKKYDFKVKARAEIQKGDPEYNFDPEKYK